MCTHAHARTHARTHTHTQTLSHTHTIYTHTHTHTHTCTLTVAYTRTLHRMYNYIHLCLLDSHLLPPPSHQPFASPALTKFLPSPTPPHLSMLSLSLSLSTTLTPVHYSSVDRHKCGLDPALGLFGKLHRGMLCLYISVLIKPTPRRTAGWCVYIFLTKGRCMQVGPNCQDACL